MVITEVIMQPINAIMEILGEGSVGQLLLYFNAPFELICFNRKFQIIKIDQEGQFLHLLH